MKRLGFSLLFLVLLLATTVFIINRERIVSPLGKITKIKEKPLDKYTFANLKNKEFPASSIRLSRVLKEEDQYISQIFYFYVDNKKVSGLLNIPKNDEGEHKIVIMLRGFVPVESYTTGVGTQRAGEVFAQNGFITLAPDFLGYGESDKPSSNPMEERFQTHTAALILLSSLKSLNDGLNASYSGTIKADISKVGIWGHSNGGQIALSILEITGKDYPTVLWAPVSKPFPYSILYYTDEFDDHGKKLRKVIADFEKDYDIEPYSPTNFFEWINSSMQIHQGETDDSVPKKWSDELVEKLVELEKDVEYFTYPNSNHNLMPNGWNQAVQRSMEFYRENFR